MGLIYLDASVLIPLLVADAHTQRVVDWYSNGEGTLIVSDLANLEVSAVVLRDLRKGRFAEEVARNALLDFDAMCANCERLTHGAADFLLAQRLTRDYSTRLAAPDALHVASAKSAGAALATFDARLAEAALGQGVEVAALVEAGPPSQIVFDFIWSAM
ncbi:MAG TPA: type II toxin-antitoxin system VapC family toxin [Roseiarcus sp.]